VAPGAAETHAAGKFGGQVRVPAHAIERGRMNRVDMPPDKFRKGRLGPGLRELLEQLWIG